MRDQLTAAQIERANLLMRILSENAILEAQDQKIKNALLMVHKTKDAGDRFGNATAKSALDTLRPEHGITKSRILALKEQINEVDNQIRMMKNAIKTENEAAQKAARDARAAARAEKAERMAEAARAERDKKVAAADAAKAAAYDAARMSPAPMPSVAQGGDASSEAEAARLRRESKPERELRKMAFAAAKALREGDIERAKGFVAVMDMLYPEWCNT